MLVLGIELVEDLGLHKLVRQAHHSNDEDVQSNGDNNHEQIVPIQSCVLCQAIGDESGAN